MTEKELHKLHRQDLLQLLVEQGKEALQLGNRLAETESSLNEMQSGNDRLKTKLNEKDEQIDRLKERLDEKDALINKLKSRLDEKDAKIHHLNADVQALQKRRQLEVDEIIRALKLGSLLDLIQQASDQYMQNLRQTQEIIVDQEPPYAIGATEDALTLTESEPEPGRAADEQSMEEESSGEPDTMRLEGEPEETCKEPGAEDTPEDTSADDPAEQSVSGEVPEAELSDAAGEAENDPEAQLAAESIDTTDTEPESVPEPDTTEENFKEDININVSAQGILSEGASGLGEPVFVKRPHFWQRWRRR